MIQNINENVFLQENTIILPYIKLEHYIINNNNYVIDTGENNLNIGINYSNSSWGINQIN